MSKSDNPRRTSYSRLIIGNLLVLLLIFVLFEGAASFLSVLYDIIKTRPIAARLYTEYDPELGWVNKPNVDLPDMYGPGIFVRINNQRFRADHDFDDNVPSGKLRIICSGDSFTFGYGVNNNCTWCQFLTTLDPRLETINMGQGGYGVDQAYLWYKRDGLKFQHQVHLLAFITNDFTRMQSNEFLGYGKPVMDVDNGMLVVKNVPVPNNAYRLPSLTTISQNLPRNLKGLRSVELLSRLLMRIGVGRETSSQPVREDVEEKTRLILHKIFEDLKTRDAEQSRQLVLVYLPQPRDLNGDGPTDWIKFIEKESHELSIPFINVLDTFRSLGNTEATEMFFQKGPIGYPPPDGHLNNHGNRLVAETIYTALKADVIALGTPGEKSERLRGISNVSPTLSSLLK